MAMDFLEVLSRWMHLASVAVLVGGMIYAWVAVAPQLHGGETGNQMAARFRPLVLAAAACLLISGVYKLLTTPGHSPVYYVLLGVKLLLVLHVFAVAVLATSPAAGPEKQARRPRMMAGVAISGLVIIALSGYLRRIF
jgi:uncharacterized membrane protein